MNERLLENRVAIITGSSRGIGAATAILFAQHGAKVVINYLRRDEAASQIVNRIQSQGGEAISIKADVTNQDAVRTLIDSTLQRYGQIDILVNNAWPGWQGGSILELDWSAYQRFLDGIVKAAYFTCKAVLPEMIKKRQGKIINVGTTSLYELNESHTPYITAKGGLLALTRGLARDVGKYNIQVNLLSPGLVWTKLDEPMPKNFGSKHAERTAMGRNATALDIAKAMLFLASDLSDFVTGIELPVCGGLLMR